MKWDLFVDHMQSPLHALYYLRTIHPQTSRAYSSNRTLDLSKLQTTIYINLIEYLKYRYTIYVQYSHLHVSWYVYVIIFF